MAADSADIIKFQILHLAGKCKYEYKNDKLYCITMQSNKSEELNKVFVACANFILAFVLITNPC